MKYHYIEQRIASTQHKVTVNVIGAGGTGSHVLSSLAAMNHVLVSLGRQPLYVKVYDPDIVTETNIGRQTFSPADVGRYKAEVLVSRINKFYGVGWHSFCHKFGEGITSEQFWIYGANITISCVDSVMSRHDIHGNLKNLAACEKRTPAYAEPFYWMDIGNNAKSGQIILGTFGYINQPTKRNTVSSLPTFFDEYPDAMENHDQPSCSMAEALLRQDLFINKIMATYAVQMLWDMLAHFRITYRGMYINLGDGKTSRIPID